jgi:hypothetical protein
MPYDLHALDFGTDGGSGAGHNVFSGTGTRICVGSITGAQYGNLNVAGNTWIAGGTIRECSGQPSGTLTSAANCDSNADIGFPPPYGGINTSVINATCSVQ